MLPQEIIRRKRDKQELSSEEINSFICGVTDGTVNDAHISAMTMAILLNGMSFSEAAELTKAMTYSGRIIDWHTDGFDGVMLDKHSTGGVGDKVSLILAPLIAACGGFVPMIAGRGLGHTGGTIDKLESIPGYKVASNLEDFRKTVKKVGCAIIGQTAELAPADSRIYAVRDVTATVESIPLITASILSKKLAAGLDVLVMDLKCGNGAFMQTLDDARHLANSIVGVAAKAGLKANAVITDMNQVLGFNVGNSLEVKESIEFLTGFKRDERLYEEVVSLCAEMLVTGNIVDNYDKAKQELIRNLDNGNAAEIFARMVSELGGDGDLINNYNKTLPQADIVKPVFAKESGYITEMITRNIGLAVITLKGGRINPSDKIDYATGFSDFVNVGEYVDSSKPIAYVHANSEDEAERAIGMIQDSVITKEKAPEVNPIIIEKISSAL